MRCHDLIIIGAGPAGLAAAIAARRADLDFRIFEKGALVNSLFRFPSQMVFFTSPELLEIGGLPFVSPREKPTRDETLRYYRRVVDACGIEVAFSHRVTAVAREPGRADGPFIVETVDGEGQAARCATRTVLLATGTYDHPNRLGVPGEDLPHVSHYYTEPHPFYRKQVVIVGGKNSAAEAALDLYRSGAHVTLVHRRAALGESIKYWVKPDIENRIKEGSVRAHFETRVVEIRDAEVVVEPEGAGGTRGVLPADAVFLLTGYLADLDFLRQCGVAVDAATNIPLHDPETYETNVPGLYLAGSVVAGANRGEVFIENGRFHGKVVVDEIARKLSAPHAESG
ncbi:MAG: YpdA family putative bacillithiol disulfide reductase [Acidobacteria bacterium]|nr:YpdA family putative bacillithiol disulfide reductase [Acidobacteriota bacterium]